MDQSPDKEHGSDALGTEAMYIWLTQLLEAHRARLARQAPGDVDEQFEAALEEVEHAFDLLRGVVAHGNTLNAIRSLIAMGVVWWQHSERRLPDPAAQWVLASFARGALWPLVITPKLPEGWFVALRFISSPEIASLVSDTRAIGVKGDIESHKAQFQQALAGSHYRDGILHMLDDLHDGAGGWPFLQVSMTSADGVQPERPKDRPALLVWLIAGASFTAQAVTGGVMGNAAYDLVKQVLGNLYTVHRAVEPPVPVQPLTSPVAQPRPSRLVLPLAPGVEMEFVLVPAGEFLMGSDPAKDKDAREEEQPQHRVYVSEFYIGKYPVTNSQYLAFAKVRSIWFGSPAGEDNHPVDEVSWNDAVAFCKWVSQVAGRNVRLPTEAEWEKAARGTDGRIYPWGNEWDASRLNSRGHIRFTPVDKYSPRGDSPYGAADMAGNVLEWVADWYEYKHRANLGFIMKDPTGPASGNDRVVRGGSWDYPQSDSRAAYRFSEPPSPGRRPYYIGFRVVAAPVS